MKSLVIVNEKGGVGKSMIATQFAFYCALQRNLKVVVLDLDHQGNTSRPLLKSGYFNQSSINSGQLLRGTEKLVFEQDKNTIIVGDNSLYLEDIVSETEDVNQLILKNLLSAIELMESSFDLLIVDTNPNPDIRMKAALCLSDYALSPIQCNSESMVGLELLIQEINDARQYNENFNYLGLLVNMLENKGYQLNTLKELIENYSDILMFNPKTNNFACIGNNIAFQEAQDDGLPIWTAKKTTAKRAWAMVRPIFELIAEKMDLPNMITVNTNKEQ